MEVTLAIVRTAARRTLSRARRKPLMRFALLANAVSPLLALRSEMGAQAAGRLHAVRRLRSLQLPLLQSLFKANGTQDDAEKTNGANSMSNLTFITALV